MSDVTCTAEELASGVYCLTHQQYIGLVVVALSGFVSLSAVLFIFTLIARNVINNRRFAAADAGIPLIENGTAGGEAPVAMGSHRRKLIEEPMDLFMLSLFLASFFQALGVVLEVKWINEGKVRAGGFCTAQGAFQTLGQSAVAIQTTIITFHTFAAIWWQRGVVRLGTAWALVGLLWLPLAVFVITVSEVPWADKHPFYYPTPYWCSIHNSHSDYRIAGESFWLWLAFAVAVALYIPLCFHSVGYISPDENAKWTFQINSREEARVVRARNLSTIKLLLCAIAYTIPVLPTALARWFLLVHNDAKPFASAEAQFAVKAIFSLCGFSDVVVFRLARQTNLLLGQPLGTRRPFNIPAPVRIVAGVTGWIILNVGAIFWIYYCNILSATDPVPRRKTNDTREGWKAYYVMMYIYGFLLGLVNIAVWLRYIRRCFTSLRPLRKLKYLFRFLIVVLAVIMCLGPFFAPFIGLKITQRTKWDRGCDSGFPVEVILDGRSYYDSVKENPLVASFYFGTQPGRRTQYYTYGMTQDDNDTTIWHLRLSNVNIPPDLDPVYHPMAQDLSYRFANHSVSATCTTNTSVPCMEGSFSDGGNALSLAIKDLGTGIVTKLRALDKGVWAPVPADDAPSVILREVQPDDSLGSIDVLRTAVTMQGDCTRLKICLSGERRIDLLAAVGLILRAQGNYAYLCTSPNSI